MSDISIAETVSYLDSLSSRDARDERRTVERCHFPSEHQVLLLRGARKVVRMMSGWDWPNPVKTSRIERGLKVLNEYLLTCWDEEGSKCFEEPWLLIQHDEFEVLNAVAGYLIEYDAQRLAEATQKKSAWGGKKGRR